MSRVSAIFILVVALSGCSKKSGPPALTIEQIPAAMSNAFKTASLLLRNGSDSVIQLVQNKEYAGATMQLNGLLANTSLDDQQRDVSSASLTTLNQILQELIQSVAATETSGSPAPSPKPPQTEEAVKAAAAMEHYLQTK
jgi:hypothetical protein